MTVSTTTSRVSYSGNGSTVTFTVPFYFIYSTDLKVYKTSSANVQTLLVEGTDYTVTGAGVISGGSITCTTAPSSDYTIIIYRDPATTQLVDYQANDPFPAETHERALDKLTMLAQRLNDVNDRSIHLSDGDASNASTELSSPLANYLIGWNSTGDALINYDPGTLATIVAYGTAHADIFSGTGSQTAFTLMYDPGALNNLDVSISGVTQRPGTDYTWTTGTTVTFTTAPPLGTNNILVRYMQGLPQGTSDAASALYTPAGTNAVATTVQAKLRETVSILDFGADPSGLTDSTSAMQNAHATGKVVYYPRGEYHTTGGITFSNGGFLGDGAGQSFIVSTDTSSGDIFLYTGTSQLECTNIQFMQSASYTKTVGSCIKIQPTSSGINSYTNILNCNFLRFPVGINFVAADHFKVTGCNFINNLNSGVQVANTINGDAGDSCFLNCEFNSSLTTGVGIEHVNSGGLRIIGCKFNKMAHGYVLNNVQNNPTGGVFFTGCSLENASDSAIALTRVPTQLSVVSIPFATPCTITWVNHGMSDGDVVYFTTTGSLPTGIIANTGYYVVNKTTDTFQISSTSGGTAINTSGSQSGTQTVIKAIPFLGVSITGSQFGGNTRCVTMGGINFAKNVSITGNIFTTVQNGYVIGMTNVSDFEISGNTFMGYGLSNTTGINIDTCTNGKIGQNIYSGLTTGPYFLYTSPTVTVAKDMQSGTATTATAGWVSYGVGLYVSPVTNVTYPRSFLTAPSLQDITIFPASTNGEVSAISLTSTTTGFTFQVFSTVTGIAANVRWQAYGIL